MNLPLLSLLGLAGAGIYYGMKRKDPNIQLSNCFFERLALPISNLFDEFASNAGLIVDRVDEDSIRINTPLQNLYGLDLVGGDNTVQYLPIELIKQIFRDFKRREDSYFFLVLLKHDSYQKQFLFSHNKTLLKTIGDFYKLELMGGEELINSVFDLYLQNTYYIENKQINRSINIDFENDKSPGFANFKKIARQAIFKNLTELDIFQSYKCLDMLSETNIQKLFKMDFEGAIWIYFDLYQKRIANFIDSLVNISKFANNKAPFIDLRDSFNREQVELMITNSVAFFKDYDEEVIGNMGTALKNAYIPKDIFRKEHIRKTPLKYGDSEFNCLVDMNYFTNYITTLHKKNTKSADIYGIDKNGAFVNYSFSAENPAPHIAIIAGTGSGKSVAKQKIIAQMINMDFHSGFASELGKSVKVRSYDVGFSDEVFVELLKSNSNNNVAHLSSNFSSFAFNIVNIDFSQDDREVQEADIQFCVDLVSVILESQHSMPLELSEAALLKEAIKIIYRDSSFQNYRVRNLKESNKTLYDEIINLGYLDNTFLKDLQGYDFLKKPLLIDVVRHCEVQMNNQQIKEDSRKSYANLAKKCGDIDKLGLFSRFDYADIKDADFISMDLNNFKESSLFTPIFLCIFQKIYLKDRNNAIKLKRKNMVRPKLLYAIEEARNFFAVPYFSIMLQKLAYEARKYNVHLCFICQEPEHIPEGVLRQLDTKIFLLTPQKKGEVINEVKKHFKAEQKVVDALNNTGLYELCIWYSNGVFNLKFEISQEEMNVFSSNPNS